MKSLYDQLTPFDLQCVASLLGFDQVSNGFTNTLYEIAPLPKGFKLGHVAIAYLEHRLNYIKSFENEIKLHQIFDTETA